MSPKQDDRVVDLERGVLTVKDVARVMRVTPRTVQLWLRTGKLRGTRPTGQWRVLRHDVLAMLARGS